jgi:hypothetical protein
VFRTGRAQDDPLPGEGGLVREHRPRVLRLAHAHSITGAKERRIRYTGAEFRRVTAECGLKETEGTVKLDAKGLGTTRCTSGDLAFVLGLGPAPVRISLGAPMRIHEFLATPTDSTTAFGTIKRGSGATIVFTRSGKPVKLGYTAVSFSRTTRKCGDGWLADHVNAGPDGLGRKDCDTAAFTSALGRVVHPVLAKVDYNPMSGQLHQVWEVFRDA